MTHPANHDDGRRPAQESLLSDIDVPERSVRRRVSVRERLNSAWDGFWTERRRRQAKRFAPPLLTLLIAVVGVSLILANLPRRTPDFATAPMNEVMDYTLLSREFNQLPVERRLSLLRDLIERLKSMSSDDSVMLAQFAASIRAQMRRQLEENVKRLAVDMMDMYAADYTSVPADAAPAFLDEKILEFTRLMEDLTGENLGLPEDPQERLDRIKRQAQRDADRARERAPNSMEAARVAGFLDFMQRDAAETASPEQRGRVTRFMRDMTRHLRGQDVSTGQERNPSL